MHFLEWMIPFEDESISEYAIRFCKKINRMYLRGVPSVAKGVLWRWSLALASGDGDGFAYHGHELGEPELCRQ